MSHLVETLSYKPEGCRWDFRWCLWNFLMAKLFRSHYGPASTPPLTETSTRNISCEVRVAGAQGWQPYYLHVAIVMIPGSVNLLESYILSRSGDGVLRCYSYFTYTAYKNILLILFSFWDICSEYSVVNRNIWFWSLSNKMKFKLFKSLSYTCCTLFLNYDFQSVMKGLFLIW